MEEEIKELKHKVEVLSGVVFILLKETGLLDKAMQDNALLRSVVEKTVGKEEVRKDKSNREDKKEDFTNILNDFDVDGKAIKN